MYLTIVKWYYCDRQYHQNIYKHGNFFQSPWLHYAHTGINIDTKSTISTINMDSLICVNIPIVIDTISSISKWNKVECSCVYKRLNFDTISSISTSWNMDLFSCEQKTIDIDMISSIMTLNMDTVLFISTFNMDSFSSVHMKINIKSITKNIDEYKQLQLWTKKNRYRYDFVDIDDIDVKYGHYL